MHKWDVRKHVPGGGKNSVNGRRFPVEDVKEHALRVGDYTGANARSNNGEIEKNQLEEDASYVVRHRLVKITTRN